MAAAQRPPNVDRSRNVPSDRNHRKAGVWGLGPQAEMRSAPVRAFCGQEHPQRSPEGIRTLATALRGRRPRPLDDGARTYLVASAFASATAETLAEFQLHQLCGLVALGYQDSNLD